MANSKYEYVRSFEQPDTLLPNTWIVVRIDGRGFSKLTTKYNFVKPNDQRGIDLMNAAAEAVMKDLTDLVLAYGNSDEYSFIFHKDCTLFERRASKLTTTIVSTFTSHYVYLWPDHFPDKPLAPPLPSFDGRAICYPSDLNLRDYVSWRQVDCHINNLYNTTFWTLVQRGGMDPREAEQRLSGTVSADKNELLFKEFGINYNNEPECFKKGTVLYRDFSQNVQAKKATTSSPVSVEPPPLAHPQPLRTRGRPQSQPIESQIENLHNQLNMTGSPGLGSTFLSAASTPSPPPGSSTSPRNMLPDPLRANPINSRASTFPLASTMPLSPPSTVTSPYGNLISPQSKPYLPTLTPLPLSPLMLKPSTKPPLSLDPPNPTTRENFSPKSAPGVFVADFAVSDHSRDSSTGVRRPPSHSASASLTMTGQPQTGRTIKRRSPSQPHLPTYLLSGNSPPVPPTIPLRISSIPMNNKPRKLSLPVHRSTSTLKQDRPYSEEKENYASPQISGSTTPRRISPSLQTNKELPSPPLSQEEELRTREKVRANSPKEAPDITSSRDRTSTDVSTRRQDQQWSVLGVLHPGIAELPASPSVQDMNNHSQPSSVQVSSTLHYPHHTPDIQALTAATAASTPKSQPFPTSQPFPSSFPILSTQIPTGKLEDVITPTPPLKDAIHAKKRGASAEYEALSTTGPPHPGGDIAQQLPSVQARLHAPLHHDEHSRFESGDRPGGKAKNRAKNKPRQVQEQHGRAVELSKTQREKERKKRSKARVVMEHVDVIKDEFWEKRPWILSGKTY